MVCLKKILCTMRGHGKQGDYNSIQTLNSVRYAAIAESGMRLVYVSLQPFGNVESFHV